MLARWLGIWPWQLDRARQSTELIPEFDLARGHWRHETALAIAARLPEILAYTGTEQPMGGVRSAARVAERTGLDVSREALVELVRRGLLAPVDHYKGHPMYAPHHLDALDPAALADAITAVAGDLLYTLDQAVKVTGLRRTDLGHAVTAGWLVPRQVKHVTILDGRASVPVSLYARTDLDALFTVPGVDWDAVRATKPRSPSLLRAFVERGPSRAQAVRSWVGELGLLYGVETWAYYSGGRGTWRILWDQDDHGHPTLTEVRESLNGNDRLTPFRDSIDCSSPSNSAVLWARQMLRPGQAVILDTETTGLGRGAVVVEIAVIDASTGETLLDTLVHPGGCEMSPGAADVHGLTDDVLQDAPPWAEVLPALVRACAGKTVLSYNAEFDHALIWQTSARDGLVPLLGELGNVDRWDCVMNRRSDRYQLDRWLRLDGGHRALADCHAALGVLHEISTRVLTTR
jgi:hypothetical protein